MDILNLKIGPDKRKLKVIDVKRETITVKEDKKIDKIIFITEDEFTGNRFNISDAWVHTDKGFQIKGLWLALQNEGNEIAKNSSLAKLMDYYDTSTLGNFVEKEIYVLPDDKNFLVLVACDLPKNFNK